MSCWLIAAAINSQGALTHKTGPTHTLAFGTADPVLLLATEYCICKKPQIFWLPEPRLSFGLGLHGSVDLSMQECRTRNRPETPASETALEPTAMDGRRLAFT